ncbi:MAG: DUF169 domain-containing protein [Dehalococcoidales bacterium]
MTDWPGLTREIERLLRLQTYPIAYKRLDDIAELEKIPNVRRLDRTATFCQLPTLVRRGGWTMGVVRNDLIERCARINGLAVTTEEEIAHEVANFATTWFATKEEAAKQMADYPLVPPGEALVLAPLASGKFDPDVVLIYGNPAQMMLLMNGLQFKDYERYNFFFIGEGACADGLAQCFTTGKPALAIPCFGERRFGGVTDDELVLALPPGMIEPAVEGLQALWNRGLRYPIMYYGPECDPTSAIAKAYPADNVLDRNSQ